MTVNSFLYMSIAAAIDHYIIFVKYIVTFGFINCGML